jgi:oxygen-independent coproporphyrinogen-3 oxidase
MAGIYLHIPFCHKACYYCDFHFSTSLKDKPAMVKALLRELEIRKDYLGNELIETIYFGGGTPSLLDESELNAILNQVYKLFSVTDNPEITLEANPDDLNSGKVKELASSPINRLSIGIQSFFDKDLKWMNRSHTSAQAVDCIGYAQNAGLNNISIDLIYGLPDSTDEEWKENLSTAFALNVPHISSYCLTVEEKTALAGFIKTGKSRPTDEEKSARQFEILMDKMKEHDFIHYEISNFCKEGKYAQHNSNYWKGVKYLGIGPSAHSYNVGTRQWNKSSNAIYISSIQNDLIPAEVEKLTVNQRFNEYVMTSLRTMWGCNMDKVKVDFGHELLNKLQIAAAPFLESQLLEKKDSTLLLTNKARFLSDKIISDLFAT